VFIKFYLNAIRPILSRIVFSIIASKYGKNEREKAQQYLDDVFASIKSLADIAELNKRLEQEGFTRIADPGGGVFDFSPEELWLFAARKGDDCDG
jgi:hypothetical protein